MGAPCISVPASRSHGSQTTLPNTMERCCGGRPALLARPLALAPPGTSHPPATPDPKHTVHALLEADPRTGGRDPVHTMREYALRVAHGGTPGGWVHW